MITAIGELAERDRKKRRNRALNVRYRNNLERYTRTKPNPLGDDLPDVEELLLPVMEPIDNDEFEFEENTPARKTLQHLMVQALAGTQKKVVSPFDETDASELIIQYLELGKQCKKLADEQAFQAFIVFCVCFASALVGASTVHRDEPIIDFLQVLIIIIFCGECVVKIMAEGRFPLKYFHGEHSVLSANVGHLYDSVIAACPAQTTGTLSISSWPMAVWPSTSHRKPLSCRWFACCALSKYSSSRIVCLSCR